jgi:serine protease Do/serine protease DegQ
MKTSLAVLSLVLTVGLLTLSAQTKPEASGKSNKSTKTGLAHPELKVDASPVGEGKAPVLTSYADVLTDVRPAVVSIYSSKIVRQRVPDLLRQLYGRNLPDQEQKLDGLGSGVIISSDGYILTNNHVVEEADELKVSLSDEREFTAKLVGTDPKTDIAVIKIEATGLPYVTLGDSEKLRVGDIVFAIGNPLGIGQTVTMGIVSATGRKNVNLLTDRAPDAYEDFIQTDAAINMGNSGGALVDAKGRLVGINSGIATNNRGNIGIGFAVPINLARSVMTSLIEHGTVIRGYLGVSTETLRPEDLKTFKLPAETRGVLVVDLSPADGPAAKAGIKREDVIVAINDRGVTSRDELRLIVAQMVPGSKAQVRVLRDGKPRTIEVVLGQLEDQVATGEFLDGVKAEAITPELRRQFRIPAEIEGIVITELDDNSPYRAMFPVGCVIESVNRVPATDVAAAREALVQGRNMAYVYYRGAYRLLRFDTR